MTFLLQMFYISYNTLFWIYVKNSRIKNTESKQAKKNSWKAAGIFDLKFINFFMEIRSTSSETAGQVIRCKGSFTYLIFFSSLSQPIRSFYIYTLNLCFLFSAAICRNPGDPLVIEEIEVDPPKAWEVRIKIICTSLCHTDVTFWKMNTVKHHHVHDLYSQ